MRLIGSLLIFALAAGQTGIPKHKRHAEAKIIWSGNQLWELCQHYKGEEKFKGGSAPACFTYITGSAETLIMTGDADMMTSPCPGTAVTREQIVDVVVKWLEDHPEKRDLPAPFIVMKSLSEAFPCD